MQLIINLFGCLKVFLIKEHFYYVNNQLVCYFPNLIRGQQQKQNASKDLIEYILEKAFFLVRLTCSLWTIKCSVVRFTELNMFMQRLGANCRSIGISFLPLSRTIRSKSIWLKRFVAFFYSKDSNAGKTRFIFHTSSSSSIFIVLKEKSREVDEEDDVGMSIFLSYSWQASSITSILCVGNALNTLILLSSFSPQLMLELQYFNKSVQGQNAIPTFLSSSKNLEINKGL